MLAFLHYFNSGLLASVPQISERIRIYLGPFEAELKEAIGIGAITALEICDRISGYLQEALDQLHDSGDSEQVLVSMKEKGLIPLRRLQADYPDLADAFWKQFSVRRGCGPNIKYPTEQSVSRVRPLIKVNDTDAFCPSVNDLYTAILIVGEAALLGSPARDRFLRARDKALEQEARIIISAFLRPTASVWCEVYETPDSQFEHDIVVVDDDLCLVIEAKAAPPVEPFRDPDRAFVRLRDAFRADRGIQKAHDQANRVISKLRAGHAVPLYDVRGREIACLEPDKFELSVGICVTRDDFGALATNLTLLLERDAADSYPWVVNILDLQNLAEAWSYFRLGTAEFRKYLDQRVALHGKVLSDDELDYAGYFLKHGDFRALLDVKADLVQLDPHYSGIFDEVYRHLHLGEPHVTLDQTEPVLTDLKASLIQGRPAFVGGNRKASSPRKVGRNDPCPCGSGNKYKRCCGAPK
ncbi:MAG: YecA family protein [Pseudomonadota bacterium]